MNTQHPAETPDISRIPADVAKPDKIIGPFTARQAAQLAVLGAGLYGGYFATRAYLAPLAYLVMIIPVAGVAITVILGRREGIGLDRYLMAALAFIRRPRRRVYAPEGVPPVPAFVPKALAGKARPLPAALELPAQGVSEAGVVDLGPDGRAGLAVGTPVNFELRTPAEQQGLIAGFARWLNALTGPVQLLVSGRQLDLAPLAAQLHTDAAGLPHVALEQAARAHADFLLALSSERQLLTRRLLLIVREPLGSTAHRPTAAGAGARVGQRLREAERALSAAEVDLVVLPAPEAARAICAVADPDDPPDQDAQAAWPETSPADGAAGRLRHVTGDLS